jgi:hypothetical protein
VNNILELGSDAQLFLHDLANFLVSIVKRFIGIASPQSNLNGQNIVEF